MENKNRIKKPLVVWRFIDGKSGHEKQTAGLISQLEKHLNIATTNIGCRSVTTNLKEIILKRYVPGLGIQKPDILLGAGHSTHLEMITAKLKYGGKSIIIMKPTLPYFMFDLCLIPKHDKPPTRKNIIVSEMPLPPAGSNRQIDENLGVFLIGGSGRHFEWSDQLIADKIENIVRHNFKSEIKWKLTTSRRTPDSFLAELRKRNLENIEVLDYKDTPSDWVESQLEVCGQTWVTQDSYSMICEAVNACRRVGILELKSKQSLLSFREKKFSNLSNLSLTTYSDWCDSFILKPNHTTKASDASLANQVLAKLNLRTKD